MLTYSQEVLYSLFGVFNGEYPALHALAWLLAAIALAACFRRGPSWHRAGLLALALLWAGHGLFWHWQTFSAVHFMARPYGALSLVQAALLAVVLFLKPGPRSARHSPIPLAVGFLLLLAVPAIALADAATGPGWPAIRLSPLHDSAIAFLTLAVLLLARLRLRPLLFALPLSFAAVAAYRAYAIDLTSDWLLPAGAFIAVTAAALDQRRLPDDAATS